jgi:hypothetical protein
VGGKGAHSTIGEWGSSEVVIRGNMLGPCRKRRVERRAAAMVSEAGDGAVCWCW